jgi:hypothetical protein
VQISEWSAPEGESSDMMNEMLDPAKKKKKKIQCGINLGRRKLSIFHLDVVLSFSISYSTFSNQT